MNVSGNGLRKIALALAQDNSTPVYYWIGLPLVELGRWFDAANELNKERIESRKRG